MTAALGRGRAREQGITGCYANRDDVAPSPVCTFGVSFQGVETAGLLKVGE
jgi:hypothetical protein